MTIRRILGLSGLTAVAGAIALILFAEKASSKDPTDPKPLATLEARIALLENRVAELEKKPAVVALPGPTAPNVIDPKNLPKGWSPRGIFNGFQVYDIPLQQGRNEKK